MKRKTKKAVRRDDNAYIASAIEWFLENRDLSEEIADFVANNEKRVVQIDWSKVSAKKILADKDFHQSVLGMIDEMIDDIKTMSEPF